MEVENTSDNVNIDHHQPTANTSDGTGDEELVNLKIPALDKYNLRVKSIQKRIEVEKKRKNPRKEPKPKQRPPPLSKYRRKNANARERTRMQEMNHAFEELKKAVPHLASDFESGEDQNSKLTKITTLRLAVNYIAALTMILSQTEPDHLSDEMNSNENNDNDGNVICPVVSNEQSLISCNISSPSPSVSSISSVISSSSSSSYSLSISSPSSSSSSSFSSSLSVQSPSSCSTSSSLSLDLQSVNLNNHQISDNLLLHPSQIPSQVTQNTVNNDNNNSVNNYQLVLSSSNQHERQFAISSSTSPSSSTSTTTSTVSNQHSSQGVSAINSNRQHLFNSSSSSPTNQQIDPNQQTNQPTNQANLIIPLHHNINDLHVESSLPLLDADCCYSCLPNVTGNDFDDFKLIDSDMIPESDFSHFKIDSEILSNPLITSW